MWRGESAPISKAPAARRAVTFQYAGTSAVTVVGAATGRRYEFPGSGAVVAADPRDAPAMAAVPFLTQVAVH
jgi:hypothetical protein